MKYTYLLNWKGPNLIHIVFSLFPRLYSISNCMIVQVHVVKLAQFRRSNCTVAIFDIHRKGYAASKRNA